MRKSSVKHIIFESGIITYLLNRLLSDDNVDGKLWIVITIMFLYQHCNVQQDNCVLVNKKDFNSMKQSVSAEQCATMKHDIVGENCHQNILSNDSHSEEVVVFQMDNTEKVTAKRQILISQSPVFAAMLSGYYIEAKQDVIPMPDISPSAFTRFLEYFENKRLQEEIQLTDYLELLSLADRYMIDDLKDTLDAFPVDQFLSFDQIAYILEHAGLHRCDKLWMKGIHFLLSSNVIDVKFVDLVICVLQGSFAVKFIDTINSVFKKHFGIL